MTDHQDAATKDRCRCGHTERSHTYEPGFYDVRGGFFDCTVVGCSCSRYAHDGSQDGAR